MQITSVTDTNYIGNPTFAVDTAGWSVAGGNLVVTNAQSFSGSTSGMFTPNSVNGYANYNVNPMSTGLPYVAQARVLAGAGQQVFIQFSGGAGSTTVVASGGWDLLTTRVVTQNVSNFDVQIGIGFELQINVIDSSVSTEQLTMGSFNYGLNHTQLFDSTVTQESYSIAIVGNMPFISDLNLSVSDNSTSSELITLLPISFISSTDGTTLSESVGIKFGIAVSVSDSSTISELTSVNIALPDLGISIVPTNPAYFTIGVKVV